MPISSCKIALAVIVSLLFSWRAIGATAASITVTANSTTPTYGARIVFTAAVVPSAATGTVVFYDGARVLGSAVLANGSASLTTSDLASGTRQIVAAYLGDATFAAGRSPALGITVSTKPGGGFGGVPTGIPSLGFPLTNFAAADLNHDGYPDLVATPSMYAPTGLPATVFVFLNNGDGTFAQGSTYLSGMPAVQIAIADVNLDGNPDLVVADASGIFFLAGRGDGTFADEEVVLAASDVSHVLIADVNGDGVPDVVAARTAAEYISVQTGNGDGTFGAPIVSPAGVSISDIGAGDFDRDGKIDIAVGSRAGYSVAVLRGMGDGTFASAVYCMHREMRWRLRRRISTAMESSISSPPIATTTRSASSWETGMARSARHSAIR